MLPSICLNIMNSKDFKCFMREESHLKDAPTLPLKRRQIITQLRNQKTRPSFTMPKVKLLDWLDPSEIDYNELVVSDDPLCLELLETMLEKDPFVLSNFSSWNGLQRNPHAIFLALKYTPKHLISWESLSTNANAIPLLKKNMNKIDWTAISHNTKAYDLLITKKNSMNDIIRELFLEDTYDPFFEMAYKDHIVKNMDWCSYCSNKDPRVMVLIDHHITITGPVRALVSWEQLSANDAAFPILKKYPEWIVLVKYVSNEHPEMATLIWTRTHELTQDAWEYMSSNPQAVDILLANLDKVSWNLAMMNTHPRMVAFIKTNPHLISWSFLACNQNAIDLIEKYVEEKTNREDVHQKNIFWKNVNKNPKGGRILEKNPEYIDYHVISKQPWIATYDYVKMRKNLLDSFGKELIECIWNPQNMEKWEAAQWNLLEN